MTRDEIRADATRLRRESRRAAGKRPRKYTLLGDAIIRLRGGENDLRTPLGFSVSIEEMLELDAAAAALGTTRSCLAREAITIHLQRLAEAHGKARWRR